MTAANDGPSTGTEPAPPRERDPRSPQRLLEAGRIVLEALQRWFAEGATARGAALAFYSLFAIAPILILGLTVAADLLGDERARAELTGLLSTVMSPAASSSLVRVLQVQEDVSWTASLSLSTAVMIFGAASFVQQLRIALHAPEHEKESRFPIWISMLVGRAVSIGIVLVLIFLLVLVALASAFAGRLLRAIELQLELPQGLLQSADLALTLVLSSFGFAALYRWMPRFRPTTSAALAGGAFAGLVFVASKYGLGFYLNRTVLSSAYGAAGSLVMTLVWLFFVCNLLLIGNEVTRVIDLRRRRREAGEEATQKT